MGCKGSKHALALHGAGCGLPERAPEPRRRSSGLVPRRHSVALRSSTIGTLSLDRAVAAVAAAGLSFDASAAAAGAGAGGGDEGMMKADNDVLDKKLLLGPSRSFGGWCPTTPPPPTKRQQKRVAAAAASRVLVVAPRTPNKTPVRGDPEEIDVWELMKGLDDDVEEEDEETDDDRAVHGGGGVDDERKARSAPGSPAVFDPEMLDAFRKALDGLTIPDDESPLPDFVIKRNGGGGGDVVDDVNKKRETIQMFPGIVKARVEVFQEKINAKTKRAKRPPSSPPPESAGRVVVYLTSLRGIRQTYEDCASTSAILRSYGVAVDERDLSMHAGFKDELRAALGQGRPPIPQVFADGQHLGGAEEVRRLHEAGGLASALGACDAAPCAAAKGAGGAQDACAGCGGVRFVPCDGCSGSCKVFVEDEDGGAFRRCPECNENGLLKCTVC